MALLLSFLLCTYFASIVFSAPSTESLVRRTANIESSSIENIVQGINATIKDRANTDITSAFDIMVFYDSTIPSNMTVATNDTKPMDRRSPAFYRQITSCPAPRRTFIGSECTPADNKEGSLQAYTVTCHRDEDVYHPYTAKFLYTSTFAERRVGHCSSKEVCINGGSPHDGALNGYGIKLAYCVHQGAFQKLSSKSVLGLKLDKQSLKKDLAGKRLNMVVSKTDLSTQLEVDKFDVEAEVEVDGETETNGVVDKCRDCMELETQQFKEGTESLKAEARMLTTGAIAGVLWLAVMSG